MKEIIGIISAVLVFVAYVPYLRDIFKGKTKPHPYSWFVWGLTTVIIFALQVSHGAGAGAYPTFASAAMGFFVCALGLRNGKKDITRMDTAFLIVALLSIPIWLFADQPTLSMILLVAIDMLSFGPTVRKAWNKPEGETLSTWIISGVRHILSIVAIQTYSLLTLFNPVVWAIANLAFGLMLVLRRRILRVR